MNTSPRFGWLVPILVLGACSDNTNSPTVLDKSSVHISADPASAPADGSSLITLSLNAVAADGVSPYTGQVTLTTGNIPVTFGSGSKGAETLTMTGGAATETVFCDNVSCTKTLFISAALASNGAASSGGVKIIFTAMERGTSTSTGGGTPSSTTTTTSGGAGTTGGNVSSTGGGNTTAASTSSGGASSGGGTGGSTGVGDGGPPPTPAPIQFLSASNPYIGIDYGPNGYSKFPQVTFTFVILDTSGKNPIPNVPVTFAPGASNAQHSYFLETQGITNAQGQVSVDVHSGQSTGPIQVNATANGFTATANSSVIGTQPSVTNSTIACGPINLPVYTGYHLPCEATSPLDFQSTCTVSLADRFGYVVAIPIAVQFFSEAGTFQVSGQVSTPAFGQPGAGQASNVLSTKGAVPWDVSPQEATGNLPQEPSYTDTCAGKLRTYNPRDALVTVIAVFTGEEAFTSNSGIWQPGDSFVDLPQPFVDATDSSVWQAGEICYGTLVDGGCGGPNHMWDAQANVFVETHVIYSGDPATSSALPQGSTITFHPLTFNLAANGGTLIGEVNWSDLNLNLMEASATYSVAALPSLNTQLTFPSVPGGPIGEGDKISMIITQVQDCDAGYILMDGGQQSNPICSYKTIISAFPEGFTGQYSLTDTNTLPSDGGMTVNVIASVHVENDIASANTQGTIH